LSYPDLLENRYPPKRRERRRVNVHIPVEVAIESAIYRGQIASNSL